MSGAHTRKRSEARGPSRGRADMDRLGKSSEAEIVATSPAELADLPEDFWDEAVVVVPPPKQAISIRVDEDVLEWFRGQGPGYQTRMNAVLRAYKEAAQRQRA